MGLTQHQLECLKFICDFIDRNGYSPSFIEIAQALSLKSKSGVNRLVNGLVSRGFIRALPGKARSIEVLRRPPETKLDKLINSANRLARGCGDEHFELAMDVLAAIEDLKND